MSQQIDINVLKPHPRNNEFFDDLNGEEFKPKEITRRDAWLHYIDGNDDQKDDCLDRQLRIIDSLSELLQARASIENNRKEVTNE